MTAICMFILALITTLSSRTFRFRVNREKLNTSRDAISRYTENRDFSIMSSNRSILVAFFGCWIVSNIHRTILCAKKPFFIHFNAVRGLTQRSEWRAIAHFGQFSRYLSHISSNLAFQLLVTLLLLYVNYVVMHLRLYYVPKSHFSFILTPLQGLCKGQNGAR